MRGEHGFSLVEALVALAVLAVAAVGLIRAAEAHVDTIRGLERRTAARLVADNRLVEARLGIPHGAAAEEMLGSRWTSAVAERGTADADLRALTVAVAPAGSDTPLILLDGFRDAGTATR